MNNYKPKYSLDRSVKYTYDYRYQARTPAQELVVVPDQVADDQKGFVDKSFPVYYVVSKKTARAKLCYEMYDLHGSGTGDMLVKIV